MPFYDYRCACGFQEEDVYRRIADRDQPRDCPLCDSGMERFFLPKRRAVTADAIPGGVWIENLGPRPVKVYSHSERLRIAKERGLEPFVRHQPLQGSDKSPHTTDWSRGSIDPYTMESAAALVRDRSKGPNYSEIDTPDIHVMTFEEVRAMNLSEIRKATGNA